jgi:Na+/H+-dicarboxylate symporter
VLYYLSTTVLAVLVGLIAVNLIQPGAGMRVEDVAAKADAPQEVRKALAEATGLSEKEVAGVFDELPSPEEEPDVRTILNNLLLQLFTDNLIASGAKTELLPLIVFSIVFAGMLTTMGSRVQAITEMIGQINDALLSFILLLMKVAPLGIFCLVAARFGEAQAEGAFVDELKKTAWYVVTVLSGLGIHALFTLPLICWIFSRRNPYRFMVQMFQALLTAFSTASSSATLPVTMECAMKKAGVSKRSTEFVLPLGATINMDGTALYEAAAALFIAQAYGVELSLFGQLTVALTATLAAIGAAGIPEAGLVTMIIVLNAAGLPLEGVALILSVDWFLDRFRTAVNAFGDSVGAAVVERSFDNVSTGPDK